MPKIHIIIISTMLACAIGFFVWGSMLQHTPKYNPQTETLTKQKKTAPQTSSKTGSPKQKTRKSPIAGSRQNQTKKLAMTLANASFNVNRISSTSFRLMNGTKLSEAETSSDIGYPMLEETQMPDDFDVMLNEPPPESDRIILFALNPSAQLGTGSSLESLIAQMQPTGLMSMLMTMTPLTPEQYVSRISGSGGAARRQTGSSGTGGPGGGRSGSSGGTVSDDHGNSRETGTEISIGDTEDGVMERRGDRDYFVFDVKKGDTICFDIDARNLGSRIDSYIILYDPDGRYVTSNDDYDGFDSYLKTTVSKDGKYALQVRDLGSRGGLQYFYELSTWED